MTHDNTVECPVSGDRAVEGASTGDYIEYDCPVCGVFQVSRTALTLAPEKDTLRQALDVAKRAASPGEVPLVSNVVSG